MHCGKSAKARVAPKRAVESCSGAAERQTAQQREQPPCPTIGTLWPEIIPAVVLDRVQRPISPREEYTMRFITGLSITALAIAASATPALAKGHLAPTGPHAFGQDVAHESYVVSEDANAKEGGEKGVEGQDIRDLEVERGAKAVEKPAKPN
jgi:hypothetical protein